ncbi:MAG: hypothetical protein KDB87_17410, partial [Flavobacteriales bacterium]|nr:hypothetical protein [Flavobacteriales bacterium]
MTPAEQQLFELLTEQGGSMGNGKAMELTGWAELDYLSARQGLEAKGLLKRGRGRGGSIQLTDKGRKTYIALAKGLFGNEANEANGLPATKPNGLSAGAASEPQAPRPKATSRSA